MDKKLLRLYAQIELARREFWYYCKLKAPDFYTDDKTYLKELCNDLQAFYEGTIDEEVVVINLPPRFGKSRTATLFVEWVLGKNQREKIMTGSYNETLSTTFSKAVRNDIQEAKADIMLPVYTDVFRDVTIKQGDGAMNLWSLDGQNNSYLATSPTGTATGFGCSLMIIDDLIKNAVEANNAVKLEEHWLWFTDTMLSRLEQGGKVIIIMTRWATKDLAGRAIAHFESLGKSVKVVSMPAKLADGTMLCDGILDANTYDDKLKTMSRDIFLANYQQEPIDIKGKLYSRFKTYDAIPRDASGHPLFEEIRNYTDTADQGDDNLCSIDYGVYNKEAYILNVLYTKDPMEKTEPATAKMLYEDKVNIADIESNNGGRGFARQVERLLMEKHKSNHTRVYAFHQSKNKKARIISNATWCMGHIYMQKGWENRYPEFYEALMSYQREGKNEHDDAPDTITGIAEKIGQGSRFNF